MSTAVLISGQLRTFAKCWPTQRWHVLRHFADPHFFITVQQQADNCSIAALRGLIAEYGADRVHLDLRDDPDLSAYLTPELSAAYHLAPYANAAPAHQLLLQHWYQNEVWKFFQSQTSLQENAESAETNLRVPTSATSATTCKKGSVQFDTIIRLRADLWFHSFEDPFERHVSRYYYDKGTQMPHVGGGLVMTLPCGSNECHTPAWGEFGGINDRFAIMGPSAARYYFTVFERLPELLAAGCPFHPESLVAASLELGNVSLHRTLKTFFSTERLDGTRRWPEITPMDMLNASLTRAA
jgi:hypothetical protein